MKETLATLRDAAFIVAIYLFFTGFVYAHAYFRTLGIPASGQADPYEILVFSYTAVLDGFAAVRHFLGAAGAGIGRVWIQAVVAVVLVVALLGVVSRLYNRWPRLYARQTAAQQWVLALLRRMTSSRLVGWVRSRKNLIGIALAVIIAMFVLPPLLAWGADKVGTADANERRLSIERFGLGVVVAFKDKEKRNYDHDFLERAKSAQKLYLVAQSSDAFYFLEIHEFGSSQAAVVRTIPKISVAQLVTQLPVRSKEAP